MLHDDFIAKVPQRGPRKFCYCGGTVLTIFATDAVPDPVFLSAVVGVNLFLDGMMHIREQFADPVILCNRQENPSVEPATTIGVCVLGISNRQSCML